MTVKDAAWAVMEEAWLQASAGGTLPANARQIMYVARPRIQELTGKPFSDKYFTKQLLPDYLPSTMSIGMLCSMRAAISRRRTCNIR